MQAPPCHPGKCAACLADGGPFFPLQKGRPLTAVGGRSFLFLPFFLYAAVARKQSSASAVKSATTGGPFPGGAAALYGFTAPAPVFHRAACRVALRPGRWAGGFLVFPRCLCTQKRREIPAVFSPILFSAYRPSRLVWPRSTQAVPMAASAAASHIRPAAGPPCSPVLGRSGAGVGVTAAACTV